jgi:hypothetical protein
MKDWRAIAKAGNPEMPAGELDRIAAPLEALEETFRPLVKDLPPDLEPCLEFGAEEEGE